MGAALPELETVEGGCLYRGVFYPDHMLAGPVGGVGAGTAAFELAQRYCTGEGIDHSPLGRPALPGSRPIPSSTGAARQQLEAVTPNTLDYVFSSHFLQTVEDWTSYLLVWNGVLRPGGRLFLYLPHPDAEIWRRGSPIVEERHRWVPDPAILRRCLPAAGYRLVGVSHEPDALMGFHVVAEKEDAVELDRKNQLRLLELAWDGSGTASLASLEQAFSGAFVGLMGLLNEDARRLELREMSNWSKVWEYPWLWHHALSRIRWPGRRLLDIGSEISPVPWFLASLGADVTMIETDPQWVSRWEEIQRRTGLRVRWHIVSDEALPAADASMDAVTSFSVIEHQPDKVRAIDEVVRILRPGGTFAVSFDICEPDMGMAFPAWNGSALTMAEFEELLWRHEAFDTAGMAPAWDLETVPEFIRWHLRAADHHNYTVGAAVLRKRPA